MRKYLARRASPRTTLVGCLAFIGAKMNLQTFATRDRTGLLFPSGALTCWREYSVPFPFPFLFPFPNHVLPSHTMGPMLRHSPCCKSTATFRKHYWQSGRRANIIHRLAVPCKHPNTIKQHFRVWKPAENRMRWDKIRQEPEGKQLPQHIPFHEEERDPVHVCRT